MELPVQWLGSPRRPRRPPLCPELELWLLGDEVDLQRRVDELLAIETAPYWAFCWGSGQALARYVLDHPELVRARTVVDFGAGSGVVGLAALKAGARRAVLVDSDALARAAAERNAALNGLTVETSATLPEAYDLLLASDVLYEAGNRELIELAIAFGREVLISDPGRRDAPRLSLDPICAYDVTTTPDVDHPLARAFIYHAPGR